MFRRPLFACAAILAGATVCHAQSQLDHPVGQLVGYAVDSGALANPTKTYQTVFSSMIKVDNSAWLRLYFSQLDLPVGSYIEVTSSLDGESQRLDADRARMWSDTTAYFNGTAVLLELHAAPGSVGNRVAMTQLAAEPLAPQPRGGSGQCGICGVDDRQPSTEAWSGRLMPVGCTASIFCEDSTIVSAGHCAQAGLTLQFNVPPSLGNCNTVNPPVADQFPVTSMQFVNGGVGNDWSVMVTGTNSLGQSAYQHQNSLRRFATTLANVGEVTSMFGFGLDQTCVRSQTQQVSTGTILTRTSNTYTFNDDVRGGNSGSGFISENNEIIGIVTHCTTQCSNIATRSDVAAFVNARNNLSLCDNVYAIAIQSTGAAGVPITVSPADVSGNGNGTTNFSRSFRHFTSVTLTAPQTSGTGCFSRWTLNGATAGAGGTLTFTVTGAATAVAVYGSCTCPCDWNQSGSLNSQDFFDFLQDFFAVNADFNHDGSTNSQDFFDFVACFFNGC